MNTEISSRLDVRYSHFELFLQTSDTCQVFSTFEQTVGWPISTSDASFCCISCKYKAKLWLGFDSGVIWHAESESGTENWVAFVVDPVSGSEVHFRIRTFWTPWKVHLDTFCGTFTRWNRFLHPKLPPKRCFRISTPNRGSRPESAEFRIRTRYLAIGKS